MARLATKASERWTAIRTTQLDRTFVFPLCGFSLSLFCNYSVGPNLGAIIPLYPAYAPSAATVCECSTEHRVTNLVPRDIVHYREHLVSCLVPPVIVRNKLERRRPVGLGGRVSRQAHFGMRPQGAFLRQRLLLCHIQDCP